MAASVLTTKQVFFYHKILSLSDNYFKRSQLCLYHSSTERKNDATLLVVYFDKSKELSYRFQIFWYDAIYTLKDTIYKDISKTAFFYDEGILIHYHFHTVLKSLSCIFHA